ncbi:MAG: tripartite tricarboxylate transporter substrate binding protein [Burkholderiales bacterium]|jgi:tripartite-type tricarboxylate transporter receptor subunit TctC
MKNTGRWLLGVVAAAALSLAQAQTYPSKPITMVVPLAAGSSLDVVLRIITQKMAENMGQPIVVENLPGAAGMIGAERFMRAAPDGYTLAAFNDAPLTMVPNLRKKIPYDPIKSFAPVGLMVNNSWTLVCNSKLPVKNVAELIALAKSKPGEINYSSGGNGSPQHMAMEIFESMAGIKLTHVPYKGTTQATLDVISGQIPVMFSGTNAVVTQVKDGKLRALATGGATRSPLLPDVPTVAESGLPGYEFVTWMGLFAPANTPKEIIARVNAELVRALDAPDLRERLIAQGVEVKTSTPEQLGALTKSRLAQMAKIIKDAGIHIE